MPFATSHARFSAALDCKDPIELLQRHLRPLLRRTKATIGADGKPIVELPPKEVFTCYVELSEAEHRFYSGLHSRTRAEFQSYLSGAEDGKTATMSTSAKYTSVLALILRLRQACNHPYLALSKVTPSSTTSPNTWGVARHVRPKSFSARRG